MPARRDRSLLIDRGSVTSGLEQNFLGQKTLQLARRNLCRLIVGREFQMQAFAVNGDSQTRRTSRKAEGNSQFLLGHLIEPPAESQQHPATFVNHQSRRRRTAHQNPPSSAIIHSTFVLNNPYGFLVKLLTESLFFRLPKPQVSMRMSDLIDPMFFCEKLSRRAQPGSFRLSFSCPATESANHPRMKGAISFPVEEPTRVIT